MCCFSLKQQAVDSKDKAPIAWALRNIELRDTLKRGCKSGRGSVSK